MGRTDGNLVEVIESYKAAAHVNRMYFERQLQVLFRFLSKAMFHFKQFEEKTEGSIYTSFQAPATQKLLSLL